MDTFVDWIAEAGYPIQRIDDYADWVTRFETAMRALPERQRAAFGAGGDGHLSAPGRNHCRLSGAGWHGSRRRSRIRPARYRGLSQELICKYLTDLKLIGALKK